MLADSLHDLQRGRRVDHIRSVQKPPITSFPGRRGCAIDSFLSLFGLCRIVFKIDVTLRGFELRKAGCIDSSFVVITSILSYDYSRIWLFLEP